MADSKPSKNRKAADTLTPTKRESEPVDMAMVDKAVTHINEIANKTMYKGSIEIGEYVLDKFYGGDVEQASSRNPHKPASYQALCKREDLVVAPAWLSVAVRVAAQERWFAGNNIDISGLSYTHKAELAKIDNGAKKKSLVKKVLDKGLSSRQLADEIKKITAKTGAKALSAPQVKAKLERTTRLLSDDRLLDFLSDTTKLKSLRDETRTALKSEAEQLVESMEEVIGRYKELIQVLEKKEVK
ncbi:hypothetical protein SAMN02745216_02533 [Desulfatibacillum alkenivorans DSM 16219]|jgi:hypothetical protein|uniref:Uncharacterized protein n=1 Tax=Desulfatibacillum alkenivorans DSM 16219 TaxID=1121393 RepID=A0A1M6N6K6_9BACT|nr:hypothetical protein [Desulfatibacillum alkenivorans]SHJ91368.1 hypothetical protein SAMN02745216_02533 [Desulfatibacillum alkenivorans DSM 16219]